MTRNTFGRFLLCAALAVGGTAGATTVTVTTSTDVIDIDGATGTITDLPGPDGIVSFSEAMIATNNTPGGIPCHLHGGLSGFDKAVWSGRP